MSELEFVMALMELEQNNPEGYELIMEKNNSFIKVFSQMDDETNKLDGIVSMMGVLGDAMAYAKSSDPSEYIDAIVLITNLLRDYNEKNKKLIESGYKLVKSENEKNWNYKV